MSNFELRKVRNQVQQSFNFAPIAPREEQLPLFGMTDLISSYTRAQAIEDGVLVQLSGDGYQGDPKFPQLVKEAGFRFPLAMTRAVFEECVDVHKQAAEALNDVEGRLWDILWMLKVAIQRMSNDGDDTVRVSLNCVLPNGHASKKRNGRAPSQVVLKCVIGPGDDMEPCMTIMWPHED